MRISLTKRVGEKLLILLLALQIIIGGNLAAFGDSPSNPPTETDSQTPLQIAARNASLPEQSDIEQTISELAVATDTTLPVPHRDPLRLKQKMIVRAKGRPPATYDLNDFNMPRVTITDLKKVSVQAGEAPNTFSFIFADGKTTYELNIEGISPRGCGTKQSSGELRAFDLQYAKHQLFQSKIPSFNIGTLDSDFVTPETKISFFSRGLKPYDTVSASNPLIPLDLSEDTLMKGENLVIYRDSPGDGRVLMGLLPFEIMRRYLSVGEKAFKKLAFLLNPKLEESDSSEYDPDPADVNAKALEYSATADGDLRNALIGLSKAGAKALDDRAMANGTAATMLKDTLPVKEWRTAYADILSEGQVQAENPKAKKLYLENPALTPLDQDKLKDAIANGDLGPYWKTLSEIKRRQIRNSTWFQHIRKTWTTSKSVKLIAALSSAVTMAAAVNELRRGVGPAWAVHIFNEFYEHFFPSVLKDTTYRVTLAKSMISLTSLVPGMFAIAGLAGYVKTGMWEPAKNLCIAGMRAFAYVSLPTYHYVAALFQQKNFVRALQRGIFPLRRIKAKSALGQRLGLDKNVFPGVTNIFQSPEGIRAENRRKEDLLAAVSKQKVQRDAAAWTLGLIVASHEEDLDPATVAMMMEQGGASPQVLAQLQTNPKFKENWTELSKEILFEIRTLGLGEENFDIAQMSEQEIAFYYTLAKRTARRLKANEINHSVLQGLKLRWEGIRTATYQAFGNWGVAQRDFLARAEPEEFTYKTGGRLLFFDYLLEVVQIALWGPRADLSTPKTRSLLTAREGEFLWSSPQHRSETLSQIIKYWNVMDSHIALVYQKDRVDRETLYDPAEEISTDGVTTTEGFWVGMKNWWANTLNLPKARHGAIQIKSIILKAYSIYGSLFFFTAARLISGSQNLHDIPLAFLYVMLVQAAQGVALWDVTARGNQMSDEQYADRVEKLESVRVGLEQGLRLDDIKQIQNYFDQMVEMYKHQDITKYPEEIRAIIESPEKLSEAVTQMPAEESDKLAKFHDASEQLEEALEEKDPAKENAASDEVRAQYTDVDQASREALLKLQGRQLLDYFLLHPPFAARANPWVVPLHIIASALVVTELNLRTTIKSFNHVAWSIQLGHGLILAALFYSGAYALDHLAIYISNNHQKWQDWITQRFNSKFGRKSSDKTQGPPCGEMLNGL